MTIAACYVSPEGIVFGADSTSTYVIGGRLHHFNYGQKLFEVGENGTLAVVTWGLGGLNLGSYRTLIAKLGDALKLKPAKSTLEAATRWADMFWKEYSTALSAELAHLALLHAKPPFIALVSPPDPASRTMAEEQIYHSAADNLYVGFCLGGYVPADRSPEAYEVVFDPLLGKPAPRRLMTAQSFWGAPSLVNRLIKGCADEVRARILSSPSWNGSAAELDALIQPSALAHPQTVPIREAIDFTHACLLTTVKAMKFSQQPRICGGPIELAVITTDRPFRWVQHKGWDASFQEG